MKEKIQSLEQLGEISKKMKAKGQIVVQCHGTFDLMHPGHIKYFEAAKALGDILIVTTTSDAFVKKGIGKPAFREHLRAESIAALACVDYVAIDPHESAQESIAILRPSIFAKGIDYEGKEKVDGHPTAAEKKQVEKFGGALAFTDTPVLFSSTALLNDHFSAMPESVRQFLDGIRKKNSEEDIEGALRKMKKVKVLVIGDAILDVYHYSNFLGRSVKEEIPRVKILGSDMFLGGSLAVANTLAGFCDSVGVVAMLGRQDAKKEQQHEEFIQHHLKKNVKSEFLFRSDAPTVVNERYVNNEPFLLKESSQVRMRKYFGLYHINESPVSHSIEEQWAKRIKKFASRFDVVIVTDYGLGMLSPELINVITSLPQFLAVNTQTNSMNFGFNMITKYGKADYISISQPEMRLALHDKHSSPVELVKRMTKIIKVKTVALTLGAMGVMLHDAKGDVSIPALSTSVVDNIGAGDAFLALSALGIYLKLPKELSGFLGAVASALSCGIIANKKTVDDDMLMKVVKGLLKTTQEPVAKSSSRRKK